MKKSEKKWMSLVKKLNLILSSFIIFLILLSFEVKSDEIKLISGTVRVIDGDSIEINKKKIRLFGIDAPELKQECLKESIPYFCGIVSKQNLKKYVQGKKINCEYTKLDRYKRILAICRLNCFFWGDDPDCEKFSLNKYMVRSGYAIAYKRYSKKYLNDQEWAKKFKLGIWNGIFENPEEWRKNN